MTFYVYVAGPLSGMPGDYLANVAEMCRASRELVDAGYCVINPAADLLDGIMSGTPLTIEQYQGRSMDLLRLLAGRTDAALYVTSMHHRDGRESAGVRREVEEAERLGIPTTYFRGGVDALRDGAS